MNKFSLLLNGLSDLIFPFSCAVCHKGLEVRLGRQYLCAECLGKIRLIIKEDICSCCGKKSAISPCMSCKEKKHYFKKARSAGIYDGVLKECIHLLKYNKKTYLARPLGKFLIDLACYKQDLSKAELLVPVPLDKRRYRERGFNQAQLLAAVVSKEIGIPISTSLHRTRNAPSQTQLSHQERLKNVKGLFKVARNNGVINKNILLIDDVFTTGATADECARALLTAGAQGVNVLTVARSE
ncbi:ComF family protein [candidate division NPL-UPA2 bacterium Unc8]|uniref:ComF family protein n=1 Tax=candidate division NPL-UPA2 bacterium Unc8 TaxID=1980939 RepID=A0A399FX66_UNCN2|nr:Amidophosphoribosyltransferase [Bacillota bacterium]MBT9137728.1 Amidophosphoribosyltransferase [Bacillota bacterium]MBT9147368.1 Amidophosphoribosyltransferase [Bacillota bacterium]RII01018.1 MAG: ComF family protein [candidate division NPL-UPA2 bacterium Unc8]